MQIGRETADELILDYVPWGVGLVIIGLALVMIGAGLANLLQGAWIAGFLFAFVGGGVCLGG
jgi:hypothetical protein